MLLALRASMSLPGAFAPVDVDGRLLVDGAVVRNLPVDVVRAMGADVVIAVDGQKIEHAAALRRALAEATVGVTMRITVLREGRRFELSMDVLEARA